LIRLRRVESGLLRSRRYELHYAPTKDGPPTEVGVRRRSATVGRLKDLIGTGDAWAFIHVADDAWEAGERGGWPVEHHWEPPA
jgi:hypothetical protein